jgi:hypothetical protein
VPPIPPFRKGRGRGEFLKTNEITFCDDFAQDDFLVSPNKKKVVFFGGEDHLL